MFSDWIPQIRHLAVTCNPSGRLATMYRDNDKVTTIVLDEKTNDRSLVMTSSFTNMVLAASFLGYLNDPQRYSQLIEHLSAAAEKLLRTKLDVTLGAGCSTIQTGYLPRQRRADWCRP